MPATRAAVAALAFAAAVAPATAAAPDYAQVQAIFDARCVVCHSGAQAPNGLALDRHAAVLEGARGGPVVVPGAARRSELVRRLRGERLPRMPLTGPPFLDDAQIALIEAWIDAGAAAGASGAATAAAASAPAPAARRPGDPVTYADVAPILLKRCVKCHTENGQRGPAPEGYVLRTHASTVAATDRVRVVPGHPAASELLRRVRGLATPRMPLDGPPWLGDDEIALVERWIADGARDAAGRPTPVPAGATLRLRGTLTAPDRLDDLSFDTGAARVDRGARVGVRVELRARVRADGGVEATRLRGR